MGVAPRIVLVLRRQKLLCVKHDAYCGLILRMGEIEVEAWLMLLAQ